MLEQAWSEIQSSIALHHALCVAVSKRQPCEKIRSCYLLGQRDFGENYVQEGVAKIKTLSDLDITWHFLGVIQSNKIKQIVRHFDWVQSVDRLAVAEKLNHQADVLNKQLNICIAVNIDQEPQKSGIDARELPDFLTACRAYKFLSVRGIMVLPRPRDNEAQQHDIFSETKQLYDDLIKRGFALDTLSMGMSNDYKVALACGSNMVRIGTRLFGARAS